MSITLAKSHKEWQSKMVKESEKEGGGIMGFFKKVFGNMFGGWQSDRAKGEREVHSIRAGKRSRTGRSRKKRKKSHEIKVRLSETLSATFSDDPIPTIHPRRGRLKRDIENKAPKVGKQREESEEKFKRYLRDNGRSDDIKLFDARQVAIAKENNQKDEEFDKELDDVIRDLKTIDVTDRRNYPNVKGRLEPLPYNHDQFND